MHLLHILFFLEAIFEFHMQASHSSGVHNRLADAILCDKLYSFLSKANAMEQSPSPILVKLLELLQDMQDF